MHPRMRRNGIVNGTIGKEHMNSAAARPGTPDTATPFVHPGIAYGCDYNPEQWGPEVWAEDVALMSEAGVDLVAINIFGWAQLEPRQGEYSWETLDTVVDLLHARGCLLYTS